MENKQWKTGDVVWLKSGGPKMTVREKESEGEKIICDWFEGMSPKVGVYLADQLTNENPTSGNGPNLSGRDFRGHGRGPSGRDFEGRGHSPSGRDFQGRGHGPFNREFESRGHGHFGRDFGSHGYASFGRMKDMARSHAAIESLRSHSIEMC
jgi:uncharacterized protein YodC (DUF2158 family)